MMKLLPVALLSLLAVVRADEPGEKPGFFGRVWRSTKDGASGALDATRKAGGKAAGVVTKPFNRDGKKQPEAKAGWRNLALTMRLDPPTVKAGETRVIDVTVNVANKGKAAVQLDFPTSQRIEVLVKDESFKTLSKWSDDQRVETEPGFILVNPGERIEYAARISTRDMRAGRQFTIEAYFPNYDRLRVSRTVVPQP
jgi:hypothetical protein